jgi:hypothetical protein
MPLSDEDRDRLVDLAAEKCELLGCGFAHWFTLRGADIWLAHRLLVVPTPDSDVNAHSARTVSPRRLAESARASITEHGADRLAAGLFSEHLVASIDEGEDVIAELLAHYDRGVRP